MPHSDKLRLVSVYPELLGTYGDTGNVCVLQQRAARRGICADVVTASVGDPMPTSGDIYLLGGGEDLNQMQAAERLQGHGAAALAKAVAGGAVVFAVCAGFQILGATFADEDGTLVPGAGLLDVVTTRSGKRAVGEVVAEPVNRPELPVLTGYENHAGRTTLGAEAVPLGRTLAGVGNSEGSRTEGACQGRVVGTYLHGPALARNPALADLLLQWVVGALPPLPDPMVEQLRSERIAAALGTPGSRFSASAGRLVSRSRY